MRYSQGVRKTLYFLQQFIHLVLAPVLILVLFVASCAANLCSRNGKPHLIWGPTPIINIKYLSEAAKLYGYPSQTVVDQVYRINQRTDFDLVLDDFLPPLRIFGVNPFRTFGAYFLYVWALFHHDIFHFFFDGGFLAPTPLRYLECQLLKLAGKKVVMMPYGSDIAIISQLEEGDRQAWLRDYPDAAQKDPLVRKQIFYFAKWADFVIGCGNQIDGYQPRQDLLLFSYLAIDTEQWRPTGEYSTADGYCGEVLVLHTPNHRALKGTEYLIEAVRDLQKQGLKVELEIVEGRPNEEVKAALKKTDILAEQFLGGYTLSAIEGMSLGKPVLSNLSRHSQSLIEKTSLRECPVVNTPVDKIKENLRMLVEHPELRKELGESGRQYVLKYHSLEALGRILDKIYRKIWFKEGVGLTVDKTAIGQTSVEHIRHPGLL